MLRIYLIIGASVVLVAILVFLGLWAFDPSIQEHARQNLPKNMDRIQEEYDAWASLDNRCHYRLAPSPTEFECTTVMESHLSIVWSLAGIIGIELGELTPSTPVDRETYPGRLRVEQIVREDLWACLHQNIHATQCMSTMGQKWPEIGLTINYFRLGSSRGGAS
jgi:hypothetical protein